MTLPINPEHLPDIITALQADGVTYLNVGRDTVDLGRGPFVLGDPPPEWRELADAVCETCGGTLRVDLRWGGIKPCPDCGGTGKPTHTLTNTGVECGVCGGIMHDHGTHECRFTNLRSSSVDVVVAELLLVDTWHGKALIREGNTQVIIDPLDRLPLLPGDLVAVLRKVES